MGTGPTLRAESRYSKAFLADKNMSVKILFEDRLSAYKWEYLQNQIQRGTSNKNMH